MTKLFVSYAREDDETFVRRLCSDLAAAQFSVWWDRTDMPGRGRTFLHELRDAIDTVDRVIAVVGPAALSSEYVRTELEHANLFAKVVVPVLRLGGYESLSPSLANLHCVDFRNDEEYVGALTELVRVLRTPEALLGRMLSLAPAIAPHFITRTAETDTLRQLVFGDMVTPLAIGPDRQVSAIVGIGGSGKSTLAAAFARMTETRRSFPDGCLWITAGEHSDPGAMLRITGAAFADDPEHYAQRETALTRLPTLFARIACLIIIDDVWDLEAVLPYVNGMGPRCRLLITTREPRIASALGAAQLVLEAMEEAQALRLLGAWARVSQEARPEAAVIARRCNNLPLAARGKSVLERNRDSAYVPRPL